VSVDVRGLVFVGTRTPAAAAMSAFARDVLGLTPRGGGAGGDHDGGGAAYFDLADGSSFAVQATGDDEPAERTVGFLVDDLDAAVTALRGAGVETDDVSEGTTQRWVHVRAPDGRLYELVQAR
jgi:catechol 2,3-dioxygenase-like lactoylglutathione lyase family enzyme